MFRVPLSAHRHAIQSKFLAEVVFFLFICRRWLDALVIHLWEILIQIHSLHSISFVVVSWHFGWSSYALSIHSVGNLIATESTLRTWPLTVKHLRMSNIDMRLWENVTYFIIDVVDTVQIWRTRWTCLFHGWISFLRWTCFHRWMCLYRWLPLLHWRIL